LENNQNQLSEKVNESSENNQNHLSENVGEISENNQKNKEDNSETEHTESESDTDSSTSNDDFNHSFIIEYNISHQVSDRPPIQPIGSMTSLIRRISFPLCFIYTDSIEEYGLNEEIEKQHMLKLKDNIVNAINQVFDIENTNRLEFFIYKKMNGLYSSEYLIFVPSIYVNCDICLFLSTFIQLAYNIQNCDIIKLQYYEFDMNPSMFMTKYIDRADNVKEPIHQFKNIFDKKQKTEDIEKHINEMSYYDHENPIPLTTLSQLYLDYCEYIRNNPGKTIPEEEDFSTLGQVGKYRTTDTIQTKNYDELKQKYGNIIDRVIGIFVKEHPDSKLKNIRELKQDSIYLFDFSKSNFTCRLCHLVHTSNRQYCLFTPHSKKLHYKCYDDKANKKKLIYSLDESPFMM
jgi:hypothetical protein